MNNNGGPSRWWYSTILAAALGLLSCKGHPRTDAELATAFYANGQWFTGLRDAYVAGDIACGRGDGAVCQIQHQDAAIDSLHSRAHVRQVYVLKGSGTADGVWMPVETYGVLSTSSSARGYAYLKRPPADTVENTLDVDAKGRYYKPLSNGWYLFVVN